MIRPPLQLATLLLLTAPAIAEIPIAFRDYPQGAVNTGIEGVAYVAWEADAAGTPLRCWTKRSSGYRGLDQATCRAVMRGPAKAAVDESGQPLASYHADHAVFRLPGSNRRLAVGTVPDATFMLRALPAGTAAPVIRVRQTVAADGAQESCTVVTPSGVSALDRIACTQAGAAAKERPLLGRDGKPVRWLAEWQIAFEAAK